MLCVLLAAASAEYTDTDTQAGPSNSLFAKSLTLVTGDSQFTKMIPEVPQTPRLENTGIFTGSGKRSTPRNSRT